MPINVIHLDMDGVLVDFLGASLKALGRKETNKDIKEWNFYRAWGITDEEFWKAVEGFEFWSGLEVLPGALELIDVAKSYCDIYIATKIEPSCKGCVNGKLASLQDNFPGIKWHLTEDKSFLASPDSVLIDDNETNCEKFEARGGHAILYPAPYNRNRHLVGFELTHVKAELDRIVFSENSVDFHHDEEVISVDEFTGGKKGTKVSRYDLIPQRPLRELARRYGYGAKKYAEHNWRKGYAWSKSYASLMRHLSAFWDGQDIDPDSEHGESHISAVAWHAFALMEFQLNNIGTDDRFTK